jgi:hypothetical protein
VIDGGFRGVVAFDERPVGERTSALLMRDIPLLAKEKAGAFRNGDSPLVDGVAQLRIALLSVC